MTNPSFLKLSSHDTIMTHGTSQMASINGQHGVNRLKSLDTQAIGAVYDQYFSEVYRYVLYRVGNQTLAEDIASDVFIRLLEAVKSGRGPESNLKGWLIGTASHVVMDHMRKKYRRPEDELPDSLPDLGPGPASEVDQREQNRLVRGAYSKLTPEQQDVLALRFGQGYSLEETASRMDKNINAVKALQFRALAALQREIGEVDYD
jgi:RNA polymerase sigma-70 factor, ECF subfamily